MKTRPSRRALPGHPPWYLGCVLEELGLRPGCGCMGCVDGPSPGQTGNGEGEAQQRGDFRKSQPRLDPGGSSGIGMGPWIIWSPGKDLDCCGPHQSVTAWGSAQDNSRFHIRLSAKESRATFNIPQATSQRVPLLLGTIVLPWDPVLLMNPSLPL